MKYIFVAILSTILIVIAGIILHIIFGILVQKVHGLFFLAVPSLCVVMWFIIDKAGEFYQSNIEKSNDS